MEMEQLFEEVLKESYNQFSASKKDCGELAYYIGQAINKLWKALDFLDSDSDEYKAINHMIGCDNVPGCLSYFFGLHDENIYYNEPL